MLHCCFLLAWAVTEGSPPLAFRPKNTSCGRSCQAQCPVVCFGQEVAPWIKSITYTILGVSSYNYSIMGLCLCRWKTGPSVSTTPLCRWQTAQLTCIGPQDSAELPSEASHWVASRALLKVQSTEAVGPRSHLLHDH